MYERYDVCMWTNEYLGGKLSLDAFASDVWDILQDYSDYKEVKKMNTIINSNKITEVDIAQEYIKTLKKLVVSFKIKANSTVYKGISDDAYDGYFAGKNPDALNGTNLNLKHLFSTTTIKEYASM